MVSWAGKKNKQQPGEKAEKPQRAEKTPEEVAALAAFDMMTEAASALMDSGELDVYSTCREEFQRAAALFAPAADIFADGDDDEDMFGDDFAAAKQVSGTPRMWPILLLPAIFQRAYVLTVELSVLLGTSVPPVPTPLQTQRHKPSLPVLNMHLICFYLKVLTTSPLSDLPPVQYDLGRLDCGSQWGWYRAGGSRAINRRAQWGQRARCRLHSRSSGGPKRRSSCTDSKAGSRDRT